MARFSKRRDTARRRLSVLTVAPAMGLFTVMAVPWLTAQAYQAQDAQVVPFELAAHGFGFSAPDRYKAGGSAPTALAAGDLNGDGVDDIAVTLDDSRAVGILLSESKNGGGFGKALRLHTGETPTSVAIGDMDGDGNRDVVVGHQFAPVRILLGDGRGSFTRLKAAADGAIQTELMRLALADLDGDDDLDVVGVGVTREVIVLRNDGQGGLTRDPGTRLPFHRYDDLAVGDLNDDKVSDVAVIAFSPAKVTVLLGTGKGGFGKPTSFAIGAAPRPPAEYARPIEARIPTRLAASAAPADSSVTFEASSVAIADLDDDGHADIAATDYYTRGVAILHGRGNGRFARPQHVGAGVEHATDVVVADTDRDRVPDLVVVLDGSRKVAVLPGRKAGGYAPAERYTAVRGGAHSLVVGHFDIGGGADLAVSDGGTNAVGILYSRVKGAIPR